MMKEVQYGDQMYIIPNVSNVPIRKLERLSMWAAGAYDAQAMQDRVGAFSDFNRNCVARNRSG